MVSRTSGILLELFAGPLSVASDNRVLIFLQSLKQRQELGVSAITDGNNCVAANSGALRALNRRAAEGGPEVLVGDGREFFQRGIDQVRARLEFGHSGQGLAIFVVP